MFIRTERLFLRPAWLEDVSELTRVFGQEAVVRMLARAPWPYTEEHARAFVAAPAQPMLPRFLITLPEEAGRIVGGCGLNEHGAGAEVGYWIAPDCWGRGYATEALGALLSLAKTAGHKRLIGRRAADNPASGQVLRKAGFLPTGYSRAFHSLGRDAQVEALEYAIELDEASGPLDAPMQRAA